MTTITVDFKRRVLFNRHRNVHLLVHEGRNISQFLTMASGSIEVLKLGRDQVATELFHLPNYDDQFYHALEVMHNSTLRKSPRAERLIQGLLTSYIKPGQLMSDDDPAELTQRKAAKRQARKNRQADKSKPTRRGRKEATPPTASGQDTFTLEALCEELGIEPGQARSRLRRAKAEKPGARWVWPENLRDSITKLISE